METNSETRDVIVVGGGLVGLCTAYSLSEAGLRVQVVERREGVGLETSYANAGMITPSMSDPWNAPGVHWTLLKELGRKDSPMLLRLGALWQYLGWGVRFLRYSTPPRFAGAMRANFALSSYSLDRFRALRGELGLDYECRTEGTLKVFRSQAGFAAGVADCRKLEDFGFAYRVLDRDEAVDLEPVLGGNAGSIAGAIHNVNDETGDAHLFCRELQSVLKRRGVSFAFDTLATGLHFDGSRLAGVQTPQGPLRAPLVVIAAAGWSPRLLMGTGIRVAIKPVKGYSLTVPMDNAALMPGRSIIDNDMHAAITPFASRIRMAGTAEFAGWNDTLDRDRLDNLWRLVETVNPALAAATDRSRATPWCGFRPMSADGNPYIGPTTIPGLYLNAGHGYLGWTQSAGSGALLAQLLGGETPAVDPAPYRVDRP